jgi:hypothetical protein
MNSSGSVGGFCTHGNESSDFIKCWEYLEWVVNHCLHKKGPASQSYFSYVVPMVLGINVVYLIRPNSID